MRILVEVSARHVHLSKKDMEKLFGQGYTLKVMKRLSQPGQFAAKETVSLIKGQKVMEGVRVIGPAREKTQIELTRTDAFNLDLGKVPLRISGNLRGTPGLRIKGRKKTILKKQGVIIAKRHLHCSAEEARKRGLKNGEKVKVKIKGKRGLVFDKVVVRIDKDYRLAMQIDTDEGNAAGINQKTWGELLKA